MDHRKRGMFLGTKMLGDPNDRESSQKVIITPNNNKTMEETSGTWVTGVVEFTYDSTICGLRIYKQLVLGCQGGRWWGPHRAVLV